MISKKLFIATVAALALLLGIVVWSGTSLMSSRQQNPTEPSKYSAVYFATGDIYYGILSWFPSPRLTNVWMLQRSVDQNNQPQVAVAPFNRAFWGPVDEIRLNPKQIVFWTKLRNDSQVIKFIENPNLLQQQQPAAQQQQPAGPAKAPMAPPAR